VADVQAASGAAFLAGACFEENDDETLQLVENSKVAEARLDFIKQLGVREDDIFYKIFLKFALNDKSWDVRQQAVLSLSKLPSIKSKIDELISSGEVDKEIIGIKIIKERKLDEYAEKLTKMIDEKSDLVVSEVFETFKVINATKYYDNVKQYIENGKSNPIRSKAIKLLPVLNIANSVDDLFDIALKVREDELKAAVVEALQEAMAEENLSDMGKIRALLDILKELLNSDKFLHVTVETGPMFNVTQKLYYAKLKEHFEGKLSVLRHAPKWDKKLLASLEVAVKDCNQKMFELDEIKEIGNKIKHFLLKLKNEKDNSSLMQLVSDLRDLLINEHHLLTEETKAQIFDKLFDKLQTLGSNWQIKRLFLETIGEVLSEDKVILLKDFLIDDTRAIRIESKKTMLKTGLEPDELPSILFKKIAVCDSSKFFRNKIFSYLSEISQLFAGKNCNIINFEENNLSDDIDLYIVDEKSYETLKLGDKKCFCILTYTIMEKARIGAMEKKGVILLQKPFVMQEIDKKIISFFR
jgi:HEAT repeat protein/DNA-directed RNA polymerase subunit H (RpoH/RPB5)